MFIDYSKAFSSISQVQMFEILSEIGFPKNLVALLKLLYNDRLADMRWNGRHVSAFTNKKGVRKGCTLSPHLFNLYPESAMRQSQIEEIAIKIGGNWTLNYFTDAA